MDCGKLKKENIKNGFQVVTKVKKYTIKKRTKTINGIEGTKSSSRTTSEKQKRAACILVRNKSVWIRFYTFKSRWLKTSCDSLSIGLGLFKRANCVPNWACGASNLRSPGKNELALTNPLAPSAFWEATFWWCADWSKSHSSGT